MKITRRQLKQSIKESITEASPAEKDAYRNQETNLQLALAGGMFQTSAAIGLGAAGLLGPGAAIAALVAVGAVMGLGYMAITEVEEASQKATAQRMNDILKRTMSMSLKRLRQQGLPEDKAKQAHNVIMNGSAEQIQAAAKEGIVDIDLNDLDKVQRNMKSSASSEFVDQEAIDKMIEELKDKLAQVA